MQQIHVDDKGNAIDQNGKIIGKKVGNTIIPIREQPKQDNTQPLTLEQRLGVSSTPKHQENVSNEPSKEIYSTYPQEHTKYEVTKDSEFVVKFGLKEENGRMIVLYRNYEEERNVQQHWVKFRMWNYEEELLWKDECMKFNVESRNFMIDTNKLNERKLKNLIKDWSFAEFSDKYKLLHVGGCLSDESYEVLKGLFPNIINAIIDLMNEVLENNG